jgi:hypothetical protein
MVLIVWNCPMNSALHVVLRLSSFLFRKPTSDDRIGKRKHS